MDRREGDRQVRGGDGDAVLTRESEGRSAGREDHESFASRQQFGDERSRAEHVLEIVDDQMELTVAKKIADAIAERLGSRVAHADGLRHGGRNKGGIANRCQGNERGTVGEVTR